MRDVTWASTCASLHTGTETCSGRSSSPHAWDAKRSDVGVPTVGTIGATSRGGLKIRRGQRVAPYASSSRRSWTARWSVRKERWNNPRLKFTTSAFLLRGCWNPGLTPELVEEFNKVLEENKNKKLSDMGLHCRAIYLRVRTKDATAPTLLAWWKSWRLRTIHAERTREPLHCHVNRTKTTYCVPFY